jgi:hypothetical protein
MSDTKIRVLTEVELGLVSGALTIINTKTQSEMSGLEKAITNSGKKLAAVSNGPFQVVLDPA